VIDVEQEGLPHHVVVGGGDLLWRLLPPPLPLVYWNVFEWLLPLLPWVLL
jgi:hypothetical protein